MKNYKKPIAAWLGLAVLSIFSMISTGAGYMDFHDPVPPSDLVETGSDEVTQKEEIIDEIIDETENKTVKETEPAIYQLGWNNTENGYAYISATGEPLIETWITDAQGRYYLGKNGIMFFNGIRKIKDHDYCFDETGNVQTGRFWYDGLEYYASDTGQLYSDEWVLMDEDIWYYISENGEIMKDSVTPDGYLLDTDGHIITEKSEVSQAFSYVSSNSHRELILKAKTGRTIWDFLKGEGWTNTAIAGVLGNFQQESGLTADMHQKGGGTGYGLGQWSGERRYALEAYAENTGQDVTQLMTQLNYLIIEPGEQGFLRQYSKTEYKSPSEAALAWARGWERYNEDGSIYRVRIPYAEAYYAYFVNGEDFVVAKESDYAIKSSEPESLTSSTTDTLLITMSTDLLVGTDSVSDSVDESESLVETTEGYGPAFDIKFNEELTAADHGDSIESESDNGLISQEIIPEPELAAETSLESFTEDDVSDGNGLVEEKQPENYGPGYTTEAAEIGNHETTKEATE